MIIQNFAVAGYRSFGKHVQYFERLAKVNVIIGRNNTGKSNVLRFIDSILSKASTCAPLALGGLDGHLPDAPPLRYGCAHRLKTDHGSVELENPQKLIPLFTKGPPTPTQINYIARVLAKKAALDGTAQAWTLYDQAHNVVPGNWYEALGELNDNDLQRLWIAMSQFINGGGRDSDWTPLVKDKLKAVALPFKSAVVPAIRQVVTGDAGDNEYTGRGLINKLAQLQNPDVHNQHDRKRFGDINHFLQSVTENSTACIEIPYKRDTILVHMDKKVLPLESLGSGIQEVIILAAVSTVLENYVVCMEEPELHLNPILQRKLIRYLCEHTSNQYFISTHSASFIDAPGVEVYHVEMREGESLVNRVTANKHRSAICEDLGYHPSDLVQANCVIWVEGPSDRIYLNHWLAKAASDLIEGIHYSVMFYGGRLAAHLSNNDIDQEIGEFISLRALNRRGVILIDSDCEQATDPLNETKERLRAEFDEGPGFAWVTDGREVENYIDHAHITAAITATKPSCTPTKKKGKYDNTLKVKLQNGKPGQASKVDIARNIASNYEANLAVHDLQARVDELVKFIRSSNPAV